MHRFKWLVIIVVMFLALYPAAELTRCIIKYNPTGARNMLSLHHDDYMELALIWGFYICIPFVLHVAFNLISRKTR